jgi:hypothetical protein
MSWRTGIARTTESSNADLARLTQVSSPLNIDFEPQFFVSAKGLAHLFEVTGTSLAVSMAL